MGPVARRQLSFILALLAAFAFTYRVVVCLAALSGTIIPEVYLNEIAVLLAFFFLPILGGWVALRLVGGVVFAVFGAVVVLFVRAVTHMGAYMWFIAEYAMLCYVLFRKESHFENQIAACEVDREKSQNLVNDLNVSYKLKGEGISILFEKYSTYYNLRKLAEKLATTISVSELLQMIVDCSLDFVPAGDIALITLAQQEESGLAVAAFRRAVKPTGIRYKLDMQQGDLFDFWVIKNRRRLIVNDTYQDFRFDVIEAQKIPGLRSVICAPILNDGRVMGTLRINSAKPKNFSNDHLRLLDTIAVLASSALANAMLFEETERLAIRDSLTGLYVRRYFYDRLKDEHRRALMTNRPLSILMCDLDHFKSCNDRFGHGVGDLMLIRFSEILTQTADSAIVCRYGGEEFALLLPELSKEQAAEVGQKICQTVEKELFTVRRERIRMTVSIGVSNMPKDSLDLETLIQRADQALYQAKRMGRNRVCLDAS
jgi:diguanylate cyclase (GGDEF)-like protein